MTLRTSSASRLPLNNQRLPNHFGRPLSAGFPLLRAGSQSLLLGRDRGLTPMVGSVTPSALDRRILC